MKNVKITLLALLFGVSLVGSPLMAQKKTDKEKKTTAVAAKSDTETPQMLMTVTKVHMNFNHKMGTMAEWKALEKEYFDKVISKNDLVVSHMVLTHYFTADNSEILIVSGYKSWNDIDKAGDKNIELTKAAWPDEKTRNAFFDKKNAYYENKHSDEIYASYPGEKSLTAKPTKPMLYYVRKSHFSFPLDGTEKEFNTLYGQYVSEVTNKNDVIKAFYPSVHAWGADKTDFNEVYVVETLADIEKMFDKDTELFKAKWTDEASRKTFNTSLDKYFTGSHGDYIYQSVPELTK